MHHCAGGLWLQGHTNRASLLCSTGKIFHCVHYLSAAPRIYVDIYAEEWNISNQTRGPAVEMNIVLHVTLRMNVYSQGLESCTKIHCTRYLSLSEAPLLSGTVAHW